MLEIVCVDWICDELQANALRDQSSSRASFEAVGMMQDVLC